MHSSRRAESPATPLARSAAAFIAVAALVGLGLQLWQSTIEAGSFLAALWTVLRFFTILTNGVVALTFGRIAIGRPASPRLIAGTTLWILLVGIVFALLLRGTVTPRGLAVPANDLLHIVSPAAAMLWWLVFAPKGRLGAGDPLRWTAFPLVYLLYALVRGAVDGRYPYPFLDVRELGFGGVALHVAAISAGFLAAGALLLVVDRQLGRRSGITPR